MELDPNCKQLIPYLVVIDQNNQVLSYTRGKAGQATDLHSKLSIGFGGHINPVDGATMDDPSGNSRKLFNPGLTVEMCIMRELKEEIGLVLKPSNHIPKLVGYVNNDADDLGQVHFGLVYIVAVDNEQVDMTKAEDSVLEPRWRNSAGLLTGGINHIRLEEWSRMIVEPLFGTRSRHIDRNLEGARAMDDGPIPKEGEQ
jgi:predicted NUDIX family phosphoesterase